MGSDPNKRGSGDESDSGEGLQPNSERPTESPSGESSDSDATIDSVNRQRSEFEQSPNDDTADSFEKTLDSVSGRGSKPRSKPIQQPSIDDGIEETFVSLPRKGESTNRARETADEIEATLDSLPRVSKVTAGDDGFHFDQATRQPGLPSHVGRYEIQRLLGEGTFGKVYQARDPRLDRIVAVKVAKSISGQTQVKRFIREARAAAQLRHPRIIPVYEYGQVDGENIIVYEFVAGETLKAYLRRKKSLSLNEAIEIVREVAEGLNYAHEQGIIHRDMKPDNVLIDASGKPNIADFGCARSIEDETHLTIDGSILGTPMYMSPEQAGGRSNTADGRTDIWSIGVMLYEMVSGKRPFEGQLSDLLFSICNKDPRPLRKVNPDVPLDIETICSKCLTREPDDRYATAKTLADELGRFQRGEPIESRRISTIQRTWMWAKRNQAVASLISAVAVTMLIGTIVSSAFAILANFEKQRRAVADIERADAQMNALMTAEASAIPVIFESLEEFQATILPELNEKLDAIAPGSVERKKDRRRLQMAILKLEADPVRKNQLAEELVEYLLDADPEDFVVCRDCLDFRKTALKDQLWSAANDFSDSSTSGKRFRAAAALALYDPYANDNWQAIDEDVANYLTALNEIEASKWLPSLKPIREFLETALREQYLDRGDDADNTPERTAAILSSLFEDDVPLLVSLVLVASPQQIPYLTDALAKTQSDAVEQLQSTLEQESFAETSIASIDVQKSNLVTALIQLNDRTQINELAGGTDMSVATDLIERLGPAATKFELLAGQIGQWESADSDVLSGILLSLGQYKQNQILTAQKADLLPILGRIFSEHPDSRVHSCARWLLMEWEFNPVLAELEDDLRRPQPDPNMNWHVDPEGNTFALFGPIDGFEMGFDEPMAAGSGIDADDIVGEPRHRKSIPRRFGICIHEVTIGHFAKYEKHFPDKLAERTKQLDLEITKLSGIADAADEETKEENAKLMKELSDRKKILKIRARQASDKLDKWFSLNLDQQIPVGSVSFFEALAYCRWLTDERKIEASDLPSVGEILTINHQFSNVDFFSTQEILEHKGYRLPTATEWEYACRGGSETMFPFGRTATHAKKYAWFATNSKERVHPVGQLKPGNTGLFDVVGNVNEWCLDWYRPELPKSANVESSMTYDDFGPQFDDHTSLFREYRGGSFSDEIRNVRSTKRFFDSPKKIFANIGFRLARTYEPSIDSPTATTTESD